MRELRPRGGSEGVESESMRISGVIMPADHRGVILTLSVASVVYYVGLPRFFRHCYDLCSHCLFCLLFRGQISNRGMEAATIVPAFDVLEHVGARLVTGQVVSLFDEFAPLMSHRNSPLGRCSSSRPCGSSSKACRARRADGDSYERHICTLRSE